MIALNTQPAEKQVVREDGALEVVNTWFSIQGEGPFAGTPAVFVRLAGCDLTCPACDTNYTDGRKLHTLDELLARVNRTHRPNWRGLIVITGGEPFRQACGQFVKALLLAGYKVQFETNGTLWDQSMSDNMVWHKCTVVCSPKTANINEKMKGVITHLKYILKDGEVDAADGLPTSSLNFGVMPIRPWFGFNGNIYVQPLDEQDEKLNETNSSAAVKSCMEHGYIYCHQLHKLLGLE